MLIKKIRTLNSLRIKHGVWGLAKFLWFEYLYGGRLIIRFEPKRKSADIATVYDFINNRPSGKTLVPDNLYSQTINWVIPDFGIGSGGHINIFRLVCHLEKKGYRCRIIIVGYTSFRTGDEARDIIKKHFFPINAEVGIGECSLKQAKFTVATSWITAYTVRNFVATQHRCYFVQDYEPYFYARSSDYYFAEATYRMGLLGITAGDWLAAKLADTYGMRTVSMGFSFDRHLYYPRKRLAPRQKRVFFYSRSVTPRRGFELGILALHKVAKYHPDVEFVLAGRSSSFYQIPFKHIDAGNVPVNDLPDLYSQCDVALVLSLTNLSLLPLELMACGCPIVSNKGENVEWLLNENNALLADPNPEALCDAIISLLVNENKRGQLIENAFRFASATSWESESEKVASFFQKME